MPRQTVNESDRMSDDQGDERRLIDLDEWTSPLAREDAAREAELRAKAAALTLREYADPWVQNRHNRNGQPLKARCQADCRRC